MNFEDDNKKQIDKLERMEKIYADSEKHESAMPRIEAEEEEDLCAFPRKIFKWVLVFTWAACIFALVAGMDFSVALCGMLFSLGIYCGLCITKFLQKKKIGDVVVSGVGCAACILLSILLLVKG